MIARRLFGGIGIAATSVLATAAVGCGGSSNDDPSPTPPEATAAANATTRATVPVGATVEAIDLPVVEWLTINHAGAGAATLVFHTNVPTTASAAGFAFGNPENVNPMLPEKDEKLSTDHTISLATGGMDLMWEVTVTTASGRTARATIESGAIVQKQYWARFGDGTPRVNLEGNRKATAAWSNLFGQSEARSGHVVLMGKKAGCTTADACLATFAGKFEADHPKLSADRLLEQHAIQIEFPDSARDYQVLLVGIPAAGVRAFYQVDVFASALR